MLGDVTVQNCPRAIAQVKLKPKMRSFKCQKNQIHLIKCTSIQLKAIWLYVPQKQNQLYKENILDFKLNLV